MTSTCIPSWSYEEDFYASLLEGSVLEIFTDVVKGKGVVARHDIEEEITVHVEPCLCCSRNLDEIRDGAPACAHCLKPLETAKQFVQRVLGSKKAAKTLPFSRVIEPIERIACRFSATGCEEEFCSARCRDSAWFAHHSILCRGKMDNEQRRAYDELFQTYDWDQDGIDFGDTVSLGVRIVAQTLSRHRHSALPLEEAFKPFALLIKVPLEKFNFAYLLTEEEELERKTPQEQYRLFCRIKQSPEEIPAVVEARTPGRTKTAMLEDLTSFLWTMFRMTDAEKCFFSCTKISEVLGAVLLNSQDRSPPTQYEQLATALQYIPAAADSLDEWWEAVQDEVGEHTREELEAGPKGQGIYLAGCLFNHSCDPNLQVSYSCTNDETLHVTALRNIKKGEELCISYIEESMPFTKRQMHLYEHYFFECRCTKCAAEAKLFV